ncbi:MAG: hypothetical protein R3D05_01355 [Dongiaceae bacterium]
MVVPVVQQNGVDQDFVRRLAILALVRDDPLRELARCGLKVWRAKADTARLACALVIPGAAPGLVDTVSS